MTEFRFRFDLVKDDLHTDITVKKDISDKDAEPVKKIIIKAKEQEVDLTPIAKYVKSKEIDFLLQNGWAIKDVRFVISKEELLEYYRKQGVEGGTDYHARDTMFPHLELYEIGIVNTELLYDNLISPCHMSGLKGGYILAELYEKHESLLRKRREQDWKQFKLSDKKSGKEAPASPPRKEKIDLSKAECKRCRNSIIEKATKSDLCQAGFKPEFVQKLDINEQAYLDTLSNLQIKFMMNAVTKKS